MTLVEGYTFTKVKTSHGTNIYVSRYGKLVKVVPCSPHVEFSKRYTTDLIRQIESLEIIDAFLICFNFFRCFFLIRTHLDESPLSGRSFSV